VDEHHLQTHFHHIVCYAVPSYKELDLQLAVAEVLRIREQQRRTSRPKASNVKSQLWQSTLIEDYPKVYNKVDSRAVVVQIPEELHILQDESNDDDDDDDDDAFAKTVAYSDIVEEEKEIPLWVMIIVASLCGLLLLLLIIIVLVLWKIVAEALRIREQQSQRRTRLSP